MEEEVKQHPKEAPQFVRYLWEDLTLEEQQKLLKSWVYKEAKKANRPPPTRGQVLRRYQPFEELGEFYKEMEVWFGLNLDDGWYRLGALHTLEGFIFYSNERFEADYLTAFSKNVKATKGMTFWPRRARSKANPWKWTTIYEVQPLLFRWSEAHQQYKVVFQGGPGVTQTFWFPAEFKDSSLGEGWVKPRHVNKFHPWVKPPRK